MGWLTYHRPHGETDREHLTRQLLTEGTHQVLADSSTNGTWYAAVKDTRTGHVHALIVLTEHHPGQDKNFSCKPMDETVGPDECTPSRAVLTALTPTENGHANEWRLRAWEALAGRRTTPTGVPITQCEQCGWNHPVTRQHCESCNQPSVFLAPDGDLLRCVSCRTTQAA